MYTYNPQNKWDSAVYKGAYSAFLVRDRGATYIKEHKYEVVKDLKMPTKKERYDAFVKLYSDKNKQVVKDLQYMQELMNKYNVGSEYAKKIDTKNINTKKEYDAAYEIFNHAMEAAYAYKSTRKYSKIMSKKYDAMVDDNNQGIYNDAQDPIIIFKANKALKSIGSIYLTDEDIQSNLQYLDNELQKQGRKVLL